MEVQFAAVPDTIDEQAGSCIDSVPDSTTKIFAHSLFVGMILEFPAKPTGVQPELLGVSV
jgi:hypothetical protein